MRHPCINLSTVMSSAFCRSSTSKNCKNINANFAKFISKKKNVKYSKNCTLISRKQTSLYIIFSDESTYFRERERKKRRDRVSVQLIWIKIHIVPPHEHNSRGRSPWTEGVYDTADADILVIAEAGWLEQSIFNQINPPNKLESQR